MGALFFVAAKEFSSQWLEVDDLKASSGLEALDRKGHLTGDTCGPSGFRTFLLRGSTCLFDSSCHFKMARELTCRWNLPKVPFLPSAMHSPHFLRDCGPPVVLIKVTILLLEMLAGFISTSPPPIPI